MPFSTRQGARSSSGRVPADSAMLGGRAHTRVRAKEPSMVKHMRNGLQGDAGFSLLELLIVVMIIGVLAAVTLASFRSYRERSQMAALVTTGDHVRAALAALAAEDTQSLYPASVTIADLASGGIPLAAADYSLTYTQMGTPLGTSYTLLLERSATGQQVCITPAQTKKTAAGACS
jgi:prepilin-type N-terminal cleavage/methylation domain-containing protein